MAKIIFEDVDTTETLAECESPVIPNPGEDVYLDKELYTVYDRWFQYTTVNGETKLSHCVVTLQEKETNIHQL